MDKVVFWKKLLSNLLVMNIISGCMPSDIGSIQKSNLGNDVTCPLGSNCAAGEPVGTIGSGSSLPPKVEVRHLIEPNLSTDLNYTTGTGLSPGGTYVRKLTIPKNFAGRLYLAGININSLSSRHVRVRFKFGVNRDIVTLPATVVQAPGITPQTPISVLVMDLRSEPFRNIRLPYDLYDYNDYQLKTDGTFANGVEPTQDSRNTGLYCRGLRIEDDPTFQGVGACDGKQNIGTSEECLYAYAKVIDQGLVKGEVKEVSGVQKEVLFPLMPSFPHIKSVTGPGYFQDSMSQKLLKPLSDSIPRSGSNIGTILFSDAANPVNSSDSKSVSFSSSSPWGSVNILGSDYYYRGPYRILNRGSSKEYGFAFDFDDLHGKYRLFRENSWVNYGAFATKPLPDDNQTSPEQDRLYFNSYLFPLATKLDLTANVAHLSSSSVDGARSEAVLASSGKTLWMDGSNARAQSRNHDLEHIGSCNVSATMEIIAKDDNNIDFVIALSKDVKLQLIRPTQYRTDTGNEVLYTNFKSCTSNAGCGSSECCFNNRCWDQTLVSQCYDSQSTQGNKIIGESCLTDLECTSLCCNRTNGQCSPHNTINSPAVLCSKPVGDFCIAKEWCQKTTVVECYKIQTGNDPLGNPTCRQQCYNVEKFGDCRNGICVPPPQTTIFSFDPNDPEACKDAVPAPKF